MATVASGSMGGYGTGGPVSSGPQEPEGAPSLEDLKKGYLDYLHTKRPEIEEQQEARKFRHNVQFTAEQVTQMQARKQPIITINKVSRKIHGVIGVLARLKQDPKAFPRTPAHEKGAELATAAIRYVADNNNWDSADYFVGEMCATDGIGGVEINLVQGGGQDPDIEILPFITDSFFYDARSYLPDFSDARYMGVGKWFDIEEAVELYPDHEEALRGSRNSGDYLTSDPDREHRWYETEGNTHRIRIVEHWYKKNGKWMWAIYTGDMVLDHGTSPLVDEDGKSACKYIAWSAYVDHDGDRYGFVRDLKPLQQELNMRRSKALITSLSRRLLAEKGAFDDVNVARREAARHDGVVEYNIGRQVDFDDQARMAETNAQFQFYESTRQEIESFGPNVAISTGEGLERASGRAIHLLQQAGLADLGPFLQSYRGWKIRVYRAIWNAIRQYWKAPRWISVTDDESIKQFVQLNEFKIDEMTGQPELYNRIGELDVDIIIDEGPDTVNAMADAFDTLEVLAHRGAEIPPDILIELAPLSLAVKKRLLEKLSPEPSPEAQRAQDLELAMAEGEVEEKIASAKLKLAQAVKALKEAMSAKDEGEGQMPDDPRKVDAEVQKIYADIAKVQIDGQVAQAKAQGDAQKQQADIQAAMQQQMLQQQQASADIENKMATAQKTRTDAELRPYEVQNAQYNADADRQVQREQRRPE